MEYAVGRSNLACIKMLVEAGAEVNVHSNYGYTPLLCASQLGSEDSVALILFWGEHGADVHAKLDDGTTAWEMAYQKPQNQKALEKVAILQQTRKSNRSDNHFHTN